MAKLPLTQEAVEQFLAARFGGQAGEVTEIGRGEWSRAYAFRRAGGDYVIRFSAFDEDFRKDRWAARFQARDLPIPKIFEIGEACGGHYALSRRAFGSPIDDLDDAGMREHLPALLALLDALRDVDVADTAGYGLWGADGNAGYESWAAYLVSIGDDRPERGSSGWPNRIHGWRARLAEFPARERSFDEGCRALAAFAAGCPSRRYLVHSDLLNGNLLVADGGIAAVLDWGSAKYGEFLYDLAWFSVWAPWYPGMRGIDFRREVIVHYAEIGLNVPDLERRLRCCELHICLESQVYNAFQQRWEFFDQVTERINQLR